MFAERERMTNVAFPLLLLKMKSKTKMLRGVGGGVVGGGGKIRDGGGGEKGK